MFFFTSRERADTEFLLFLLLFDNHNHLITAQAPAPNTWGQGPHSVSPLCFSLGLFWSESTLQSSLFDWVLKVIYVDKEKAFLDPMNHISHIPFCNTNTCKGAYTRSCPPPSSLIRLLIRNRKLREGGSGGSGGRGVIMAFTKSLLCLRLKCLLGEH